MKLFSKALNFLKNKEVISYIIFGILTTLVNYSVYIFCRNYIGIEHVMLNTLIAWLFAVIFAYITNKLLVFKNWNLKTGHIFKEFTQFISSRLFSGLLDITIMKIFVDMLGFNDLIMKIISNIFIIILNYLLSKKIFVKIDKE